MIEFRHLQLSLQQVRLFAGAGRKGIDMQACVGRLYGDDQLAGMDGKGPFVGIAYDKPGFAVEIVRPVAGMIALYGLEFCFPRLHNLRPIGKGLGKIDLI
jgi:hypothetical protein